VSAALFGLSYIIGFGLLKSYLPGMNDSFAQASAQASAYH
jgi:hypothetical protein